MFVKEKKILGMMLISYSGLYQYKDGVIAGI